MRRSLPFIRTMLTVQNGLLWILARPFSRREVRRILLYRTARIGDFVVTIPAMVALRTRYPNAEIVLLSPTSTTATAESVSRSLQGAARSPWFAFVEGSTIDRVVSLPGHDRRTMLSVARETIRETRPDVVVLLSSNLETFVQRLRKVLFFRAASFRGGIFGWRMRQSLEFDPHVQHEAGMLENNVASAAKSVYETPGMPPFSAGELQFRLARDASSIERVDALIHERGLEGRRLVALFPGATFDHKRWPIVHWKALVDSLRSLPGLCLVVLGAESDRPATRSLVESVQGEIIDLTGTMSLLELTEFFRRCAMYIGSDTGPMHLATAVGIPTVGIMNYQELGDSWSPWNSPELGLKHDVPCKGCYSFERCPIGTKVCIVDLPVERVLAAALPYLVPAASPADA